jgi:hypothetical protein
MTSTGLPARVTVVSAAAIFTAFLFAAAAVLFTTVLFTAFLFAASAATVAMSATGDLEFSFGEFG